MEFVDLAAQRARLRASIDAGVMAVLDHGKFILGPEVAQLEAQLGERVGAHAVGCASGTDAIVLALRALEIGPGDGVIVPSFTFCATAEAVVLVGAVPIFADVDRESALITTATASAAFDAAAAAGVVVKAVVLVDLFGQPVDPTGLATLAAAHGATLIADAAQSYGATLDGASVGALVPVSTTSFFPSKPLGCYGDGGAVFVTDESLVGLLKSLRVHGQGADKYDNVRIGTNSRLDTVQAAVLLAKLAVFDDELDARRELARRYDDGLGEVTRPLTVDPRAESAWAQYTVALANRDDVAAAAKDAGVPTAVYYRAPLHRQPAYSSGLASDDLSNSEWLSDHVLSLPMHPYMSDDDVALVIDVVRRTAIAD